MKPGSAGPGMPGIHPIIFDDDGKVYTIGSDFDLDGLPDIAAAASLDDLLTGSNQGSVLLFSGADGSIHLLAADGRPLDHFNYGTAIGGLATVAVGGRPGCVAGPR